MQDNLKVKAAGAYLYGSNKSCYLYDILTTFCVSELQRTVLINWLI
jgi:hypothetical protein